MDDIAHLSYTRMWLSVTCHHSRIFYVMEEALTDIVSAWKLAEPLVFCLRCAGKVKVSFSVDLPHAFACIVCVVGFFCCHFM